MFAERLRVAIGLRMEPTGLLHMALSDQTKPLRRYFAVRMLLHMAHTHAEVQWLHGFAFRQTCSSKAHWLLAGSVMCMLLAIRST
jgi:hypothetical protein